MGGNKEREVRSMDRVQTGVKMTLSQEGSEFSAAVFHVFVASRHLREITGV